VLNDLTLGEIAEQRGISRQAVHDMIRRSTRALSEYEQKLHLIEKFVRIREKVEQIHRLASETVAADAAEPMAQMVSLSNEILEEL
jgi:hypothetical protein